MTWLRYVPLADIAKYLVNGWRIRDDMATAHHGRHAVLMIWEGEGEPG